MTWGSRFQLEMVKGSLVFVIGTFDDQHLQERGSLGCGFLNKMLTTIWWLFIHNYDDLQVDKEAKSYGDILQVDFWNTNRQPIDWGIINQSTRNQMYDRDNQSTNPSTAGWLWGRLSQTCTEVHERIPLVRLMQWKMYRSTCIFQVQDCLSISPMAAEDRRRHSEQHVVALGVVDQHGERQRDVRDSLCLQEWSSSKGWELGWVAKKVAGAFS